tara:strand:+ start:238 stop:450 length:213 start_codon:yes stop_codon:yes gene_type:complete
VVAVEEEVVLGEEDHLILLLLAPDVQVLLIQNPLLYLEVAVKQDFKATPMVVGEVAVAVDPVVDPVVIKV